jgi:hypothetical protein
VETIVVPDGVNTAIHRFFISCNPPFSATVSTFGGLDEFRFIWQLAGQNGQQHTGFITRRTESVLVNPLSPGEYTFAVYNMPRECEVTSPGGRSRTVSVPPEGGVALQVTVVCSEVDRRPAITDFRWSYADGTAAMYIAASDSDADITQFTFDITDCNGRSVLVGGEITRGGLQSWHTASNPRPEIVSAMVVQLTAGSPTTLCGALRLFDSGGNTTPRSERVQTPAGPFEVQVTAYNAAFIGGNRLVTALAVSDIGGLYAGAALAVRVRDGLLGSADGKEDIGDYNNQGFPPGAFIPDVEVGPGRRIASADDVHGHILVLVDRMGRFRRLIDDDLFR